VEYIATAALIAGWAIVEFAVEPREDPRWSGGILFDDAARDALVSETREGRNRAGRISDYTALAPQVTLFADTIIVPWARGGSFKLIWQMNVMNAEALASSGLISRLGHRLAGRERPDTEPCREDHDYDQTCFGGTLASFPSGHVAGAMTSAGLACAHHLYAGLYEYPALDWAACGLSTSLGITTGVLRTVGDRHYVSDVIAGGVLGFGLGFGLPTLLHYRPLFGGGVAAAAWTMAPIVGNGEAGLVALGAF
jgi:membrane-associated phospholipid phosphatase